MNKELVSCNLCEKDEFVPVFSDPKTGYGHGYCGNCGLIYVNPRMDAKKRGEFYSTYSQKYPDKFLKDINNPYRKIANKRAEIFSTFIREYNYCPTSFLEVGCSYGFFLSELDKQKLDINLQGIEPSSVEGDFAKNILGLRNIYHGSAEDFGMLGKRFDVIALFHVLEHVGDPMCVLRLLHTLLNPDGLIWVEVPDAEQLNGDLIEFQHVISCQHLYEFSPNTLNQMLLSVGFEKVVLEDAPLCSFLQCNQRAIYRKENKKKNSYVKDSKSAKSLSTFYSNIKQIKNNLQSWIDIQKEKEMSIKIYGGGFHTMRLLRLLDLNRYPIDAIVDDDIKKHGNFMECIPIVSPSTLEKDEPCAILVSTLVCEKPILERLKPLKDRGWEIKTIYAEG